MKINPAPTFPVLHGKIGDHIVQRRAGKLYLRKTFTPRNPRSPAQLLIRNAQTICTKHFQQINPLEIQHWDTVVLQKKMLAHNAFLKENTKAQATSHWKILSLHNSQYTDMPPIAFQSATSDSVNISWTPYGSGPDRVRACARKTFTTPDDHLITPAEIFPMIWSWIAVSWAGQITCRILEPNTEYIFYLTTGRYRWQPPQPPNWHVGKSQYLIASTTP